MTSAGTSTDGNPYAELAAQNATPEVAAAVTAAGPVRRGRPSRQAGAYAGVALVFLLAFALAGTFWGLIRPTYTAYVEDPENATIAVAANVEFLGFAWFTVLSGALAAGLALTVFLRSPATRGPLMLYWVGVLGFLGAHVFIMFGEISANLLHRVPADYSAVVGGTFEVVPTFTAGSAVLAAPFLAVCIYWCATWVTPEEAPGDTPEPTLPAAQA